MSKFLLFKICYVCKKNINLIYCRGGEIGRRAGFKIQCPYGRVGSIPTLGTNYLTELLLSFSVAWSRASLPSSRIGFIALSTCSSTLSTSSIVCLSP